MYDWRIESRTEWQFWREMCAYGIRTASHWTCVFFLLLWWRIYRNSCERSMWSWFLNCYFVYTNSIHFKSIKFTCVRFQTNVKNSIDATVEQTEQFGASQFSFNSKFIIELDDSCNHRASPIIIRTDNHWQPHDQQQWQQFLYVSLTVPLILNQ